jgi:hypothetical protein
MDGWIGVYNDRTFTELQISRHFVVGWTKLVMDEYWMKGSGMAEGWSGVDVSSSHRPSGAHPSVSGVVSIGSFHRASSSMNILWMDVWMRFDLILGGGWMNVSGLAKGGWKWM